MEIAFQPEVICAKHKRVSLKCPDCRERHYTIDGEREWNGYPVKSVTEILKEIGDKFGPAAWWGMKIGVQGLLRLDGDGDLPNPATVENVVPLLTKHKLTVNHVRDAAGTRGTGVHQVAENWANGQGFWATDCPESEQGYVEALACFIEDHDPKPIESEVQVGSKQYAYAGTFDLLARKDLQLGLYDYKTSTGVYPQMHLQLAAYEYARLEAGEAPTDFQAIVHLKADGTYAVIENRATAEQWLDCLRAYRALSSLKQSLKVAA